MINNQILMIEAGRTEKNYWTDLRRYRELFVVLAWRDISVRYRQTIIGILWAIIRSFLTVVIFTAIFGRIAKLWNNIVHWKVVIIYLIKTLAVLISSERMLVRR